MKLSFENLVIRARSHDMASKLKRLQQSWRRLDAVCWKVMGCGLAMLASGGSFVHAQVCGPQWITEQGFAGVGIGRAQCAVEWDPDGAGPIQPKLVVGGYFTIAGNVTANRIAVWDGTSWSNLGVGFNGSVTALAVRTNGELIAAGAFTKSGSATVNYIARWNGASWAAMSFGMNGPVRALQAMPNGDLVAGGDFTDAGHVSGTSCVARWNGSRWVTMGNGITQPFSGASVRALALLPGGDLVVGGSFTQAGSTAVLNLAKWSSATWTNLSIGTSLPVASLAVNGTDLYAAAVQVGSNDYGYDYVWRNRTGLWTLVSTAYWVYGNSASLCTVGGITYVGYDYLGSSQYGAIWNLTDPSPAHILYTNQNVPTLGQYGGKLLVLGDEYDTFIDSTDSASGVLVNGIGVWNGTELSVLGKSVSGSPSVNESGFVSELEQMSDGTLAIAGNNLYANGGFTGLLRWNGAELSRWQASPPLGIRDLLPLPGGELIAVGTSYGGVSPGVSRWNGSAWTPMGSGFNGNVHAVVGLPNGDVVVGGEFTTADGLPANRVARWNGSSWNSVGLGLDGTVYALAVLNDGTLVVGGDFVAAGGSAALRVAKWTGSAWQPLGTGMNNTVWALEVLNDHVIAAGSFTTAGGVPANRIAKWEGSTWSPLGSGTSNTVRALKADRGQLLVGGDFDAAGGSAANHVARWDGAAWSPMETGPSGPVYAIARYGEEILVGGGFTFANGKLATNIARWSDTGRPSITNQPVSTTVPVGESIVLTTQVSASYSGVSFQWLRNNAVVHDGPAGAAPAGGFVVGASGLLSTTTGQLTQNLTITGTQASDAGNYSIVYSNSCGDTFSEIAPVIIGSPCQGDFNHDGLVEDTDFSIFVVAYNILDCADPAMGPSCLADLNTDGFVDDADFSIFVVAYNALLCP